MAVWLVRAGGHGEHEQKFIHENRIYITWDGLNVDIGKIPDREKLIADMTDIYPESKKNTIRNWSRQLWPFAHEMKTGDLVIVPLKSQPSIQIGEITSDYQFSAKESDPYFHWRTVKWIGDGIPRSHFGQDLLFSFGAFLTICKIQRNNAEARIQAMRANKWSPELIEAAINAGAASVSDEEETGSSDLEELGSDQIAKLIEARFKGHELTRLVEAILKTQGYTTYRSPAGADGGADILAGAGPLGFGQPRLCIEVKSGDSPADRPAVDKLLGAVSKFGAQEGLFVSWNGFKSSVFKEMAPSFFKVRLWTRKELLEALFNTYDRLDDNIKAELPLKRIWSVAQQDE